MKQLKQGRHDLRDDPTTVCKMNKPVDNLLY